MYGTGLEIRRRASVPISPSYQSVIYINRLAGGIVPSCPGWFLRVSTCLGTKLGPGDLTLDTQFGRATLNTLDHSIPPVSDGASPVFSMPAQGLSQSELIRTVLTRPSSPDAATQYGAFPLQTFFPSVSSAHLGATEWNPCAFAPIVRTRPCSVFGRPVHLSGLLPLITHACGPAAPGCRRAGLPPLRRRNSELRPRE